MMAIPNIHKGKYIFHFTDIRNLIDSEDDFDMLKAIGMADSIAVNGFWEGRLASGADGMKATVMKIRDRQ